MGEMEMVTTGEMEMEMMEAMEIMVMAMVAVIRAMDRTAESEANSRFENQRPVVHLPWFTKSLHVDMSPNHCNLWQKCHGLCWSYVFDVKSHFEDNGYSQGQYGRGQDSYHHEHYHHYHHHHNYDTNQAGTPGHRWYVQKDLDKSFAERMTGSCLTFYTTPDRFIFEERFLLQGLAIYII